jgi:molybdopterin/thiamine biosynthesis adenylyltransferase
MELLSEQAQRLAERVDRYQGLLSAATLHKAHVLVVGTGAIGRQVAIQLAAMGVGNMTIVDFDKVEPHNMGPQGYWPSDLGEFKIDAMKSELVGINPDLKLTALNRKFVAGDVKDCGYIVACVDNMDVRKDIFEAATADMLDLRLFVDGRMAAESMEVHYVWDDASAQHWRDSWFPPSEMFKEGCTAKATIYCASLAAAFISSGISKAMRGLDLPYTTHLSLLGLSLVNEYAPVPE